METDAQLVDAWRNGDRAAAGRLFDRHFDSVYRFFSSKVELGQVDDLVQQTYLGLLEARERFRGDASARTFVLAIARHQLLEHLRSRRRESGFDPAVSSLQDTGPSPSSLAARREASAALAEALGRLPLDLQLALELYYWERLPAPDLAVVLEIPEGTVRSRLRRAVALLREHLDAGSRAELEPQVAAWERDLDAPARAGSAA